MPVPLYLSRVVIIFASPRSKFGIFDLILGKISHSQTPPGYPCLWRSLYIWMIIKNYRTRKDSAIVIKKKRKKIEMVENIFLPITPP
jgi:hypothetical protein